MKGKGRALALALTVALAAGAVAAVVVARPSRTGRSGLAALQAKNMPAFERAREAERGGEADTEAAELAESYLERAYPADGITFEQTQRAAADAAKVRARGSSLTSKWDAVGPVTLDVDRLGTQTYQRGTQWSGRTTAMAIDPKCKPQECTLYVGAAGGGLWRSKNALAPTPAWKFVGDGIPSTAVGSITVDPTDATGKTVYVGTGEGNNSGDSAAGVGVYRTTDDGAHWTLLAGSFAPAANHAVTGIAIDPANPRHLLIGTAGGTRGAASNGGAATRGAPANRGIWESTDGGATFTKSLAPAAANGTTTVNELKWDPRGGTTVYAAVAGVGLLRSTQAGASGSWERIFAGTRGRYTFSPTPLPNGKTRIYLADANGGGQSSQAYRLDDASAPAASLTASDNAAWARLSSPVDGTPGYASWGYCDGQCTYDMFIASPPDRPDMVVLGGLMNYDELPPYGGPGSDRSSGRAVLLSTDAGATWTDQTGDAQLPGESMHPDQHTIAFVAGNPDVMFVGSDGGVIRTSGTYSDISSQCADRGLSALFLADCQAWLKRVPTLLEPVNAGLATLQLQAIAVNPADPSGEALAGTQDNGSISFHGSPTWTLGLTGDGADAGFDAVNPQIRFHTYYNGWMDVNFQGDDPETWVWVSDALLFNPDGVSFYPPTLADPVRGGTIFIGTRNVWRTQDSGGDRAFLEAHCNTTNQFGTSDRLFTGDCGDFVRIGNGQALTGTAYGTTKAGGSVAALGRARDPDTLWAATSAGRLFVSRNANGAAAGVTYTRIDTPAQPNRFVSSITVDPANPLRAIVTYSGYGSNTPATPGHVFEVVYDATAGTAAFTDLSADLGDTPVLDAVLDPVSGDVYASTDFGVSRLAAGSGTWTNAADGMPFVSVPGLTLSEGKTNGTRYVYAATHGRGAYRLTLRQ
ncbi:MAG: WD40/YVTN/BNR-like repeat-containing protein [Pseudomonadota bacterium]